MTTIRLGLHNQGDTAPTPDHGWDVQCLTERSSKPLPNWADRHTSRRLKGLAIDWNPDVLDVRHKGSELSFFGRAGITPNRGRLWIEASFAVAPYINVAVVCSHRINDNDGSQHPASAFIRRRLWNHHARGDRRLFRRLIRRGFIVLYGGDINDHAAGLDPLTRLLLGHYDAIGYSDGLRLIGKPVSGGRLGSDHGRFTATFAVTHCHHQIPK